MPSREDERGDRRSHRPAEHPDRALAESEARAQLGEGSGELLHRLGDDRSLQVEHRVLVAEAHQLLLAPGGKSGAAQGQAEVDAPGIEPRQGQRGGERGLGAWGLLQVPGHHDRR